MNEVIGMNRQSVNIKKHLKYIEIFCSEFDDNFRTFFNYAVTPKVNKNFTIIQSLI